MELTPMRVSWKGPSAGSFVDLGGTLSNVKLNVEFTKADIKADQSGTTVRDRRVSGLKITVETELLQIKDKDIWKVVFPHAHEVTSGGNKMMYFTTNMGDSDLANAGVLKLHPLSLADADLSGDYYFYKACGDAKSEISYGPESQIKLKIVWNIMPDDSVTPERFMIHGDPSIGITNASAGTSSFSGTGNGTMGSVSVFNGITKDETITAVCIHASTNAGIFQVSGSVSGPLGNATVAVGFTSSVIAFTIADGSTDFIIGDTFTVVTTAANYV
jgi:hypothetical protein